MLSNWMTRDDTNTIKSDIALVYITWDIYFSKAFFLDILDAY